MKKILPLFAFLTSLSTLTAATVVPSANTSVEGDVNNLFPFETGGIVRYQQVYASSEFAGPIAINQIAFRPDSVVGFGFSQVLSGVQIHLSTTSAAVDGLSTTFSDNIGADNTLVYSGSLSLSSAFTAGPGNTRAFDIIINLQTPFTYTPSQGNLLLEIQVPSGGFGPAFDASDIVGDSTSRIRAFSSTTATTGFVDSVGLITQFDGTPIPEPATILISGLGLAGLIVARRRRTS